MSDVRSDFQKTAEDLARVGKDAAYVAIGLGVVGLQRAQVARRELSKQLEGQVASFAGPLGEARVHFGRAWKEFDKAVAQLIERADASIDPLAERLPEELQAVVKQARQTRDQVRGLITEQLSAA
jgi:hypothetical protein